MKIKKIISLIESLNDNELKQLMSYLNEEVDLNQYSPKIQRLIKKRDAEEIAKLIEYGEIEETKDLLMLEDSGGYSVAFYLAQNSEDTGWSTNDKEILMLQNNKHEWSVAHILARYSHVTKWSTRDKEILMLKNGWGLSVAHILAEKHPTWTTKDPEILNLVNFSGETVKELLTIKRNIRSLK